MVKWDIHSTVIYSSKREVLLWTIVGASIVLAILALQHQRHELSVLRSELSKSAADFETLKAEVRGIKEDVLLIYRSDLLGIEFQYPSAWGDVVIETSPGHNAGKKYRGRFSGNQLIAFGGDSRDFREDRGKEFFDFRGDVKEVTDLKPAGSLLLGDGSTAALFKDQEISQLIDVNGRAAMIFLHGPEFYGLAIRYSRIPEEDKARFDAMVQSIEFIR